MTSKKPKRLLGSVPFLLATLLLCGVGGYLFADIRAKRAVAAWDPSQRGESHGPASKRLGFAWPPELGQPFPDLELVSDSGAVRRLSDFKGKVILVEPVGMNCPACNAFAGAHGTGGYKGTNPQLGLPSIEELLPRYAKGLTVDDDRLVLIHLLLYNMAYGAPTPGDVRKWSEHFGFDRCPNVVVMVGDERFLGPESFKMIPGFYLIDGDFVLRADSTGHQPRHDLFRYLLPMIPGLL